VAPLRHARQVFVRPDSILPAAEALVPEIAPIAQVISQLGFTTLLALD